MKNNYNNINELPVLIHGFRNDKDKNIRARVVDWLADKKYDDAEPSCSTVKAEKGLGIVRSLYCYLLKPQRPYDFVVFMFRLSTMPKSVDRGVTPFDSGGLWHDHHIKNCSEDDKRNIFHQLNYTFTDFMPLFFKYLADNYLDWPNIKKVCSAYMDCKPPLTPWCRNYELAQPDQQHNKAYCWEVRIPETEAHNVLDLKCLVLEEQMYRQIEIDILLGKITKLSSAQFKAIEKTITIITYEDVRYLDGIAVSKAKQHLLAML